MSLRTHTLKNILHCAATKSLRTAARVASDGANPPAAFSVEEHKERLRAGLLEVAASRVGGNQAASGSGGTGPSHPLLSQAGSLAHDNDAFNRLVQLEPLTGGNSNAAFVVRVGETVEAVSTEPLLLRVYGDAMQHIVDRELDVGGMSMACRHSLAPAIVALFDWGRLEAFLDGFTTGSTALWLCTDEPWHLEATATVLRTLHHRVVDAPRTECAFGTLTRRLLERLRIFTAADSEGGRFVAEWEQEVQWLREQCTTVPMVFSHNDLNPSNIMWKPQAPATGQQVDGDGPVVVSHACPRTGDRVSTTVYLIDFEYSGWNYRCFDLGNTLCEMDYDYTEGGQSTASPTDASDDDVDASQWVLHHPAGAPTTTTCIENAAGFDKPLVRAEEGTTRPTGSSRDGQHRCPFAPHLPQRVVAEARRVRTADNTANGAVGMQHQEVASATTKEDVLASHIIVNFVAPYFNVSHRRLTESHLREVVLGMLCSHVVWGLWGCTVCADGVKDASNGSVAFPRGCSGLDYAAYAECRLREYDALKAWAVQEGLIPS